MPRLGVDWKARGETVQWFSRSCFGVENVRKSRDVWVSEQELFREVFEAALLRLGATAKRKGEGASVPERSGFVSKLRTVRIFDDIHLVFHQY